MLNFSSNIPDTDPISGDYWLANLVCEIEEVVLFVEVSPFRCALGYCGLYPQSLHEMILLQWAHSVSLKAMKRQRTF